MSRGRGVLGLGGGAGAPLKAGTPQICTRVLLSPHPGPALVGKCSVMGDAWP